MKRFISLLLSVVFMITLMFSFPIRAKAANASSWEEFVAQFNSIKGSGGTITLTGNVNKTNSDEVDLIASKPVTVQAGSYSISLGGGKVKLQNAIINKASNGAAVTVGDGAVLNIGTDTIINGQNFCLDIKGGGTAIMSGGAIITAQIVAALGVYVRKSEGKMGVFKIDNPSAYIEANGKSSYGIFCSGQLIISERAEVYADGIASCAIFIDNGGSAKISDGAIKAVGASSSGLSNYGTATIDGGKIEGDGMGADAVMGLLKLNGGEIISRDDNSYALRVWQDANAQITGGEITGVGCGIATFGSADVDISGGVVSVPQSGGIRIGIDVDPSAHVSIRGSAKIYGYKIGVQVYPQGRLSVTGGTIYAETGISGTGDIYIDGGVIKSEGENGIGINAHGNLTVASGSIYGRKYALSLADTSNTIIYKGQISNGSDTIDTIYVVNDPKLIIYTAVQWDKLFGAAEGLKNYHIRKSFELSEPSTIALEMGQNRTVTLNPVGEKPNGDLIAMKDFVMGEGVTIIKDSANKKEIARLTVSGNDLSFTPINPGTGTLTIVDTITFNGHKDIAINVTEQQANEINLPSVVTNNPSNITEKSALLSGNVTANGGAEVTERGFVYSKSQNPTIDGSTKAPAGSGTGSYEASISGLEADTIYYARAYAINSKGVSYGESVTFKTLTAADEGDNDNDDTDKDEDKDGENNNDVKDNNNTSNELDNVPKTGDTSSSPTVSGFAALIISGAAILRWRKANK